MLAFAQYVMCCRLRYRVLKIGLQSAATARQRLHGRTPSASATCAAPCGPRAASSESTHPSRSQGVRVAVGMPGPAEGPNPGRTAVPGRRERPPREKDCRAGRAASVSQGLPARGIRAATLRSGARGALREPGSGHATGPRPVAGAAARVRGGGARGGESGWGRESGDWWELIPGLGIRPASLPTGQRYSDGTECGGGKLGGGRDSIDVNTSID